MKARYGLALAVVLAALLAAPAHSATTCQAYTPGTPLQVQLTIAPPTTDQYNNPLPAGTVLTYSIYMGTSSGGETLLSSGLSGTTQTISSGLAAGNSYYFQATATSAGATGGTGAKSNEVCKGPFPAAVPGTFTITVADNAISLTFTPLGDSIDGNPAESGLF